MYDYQTERPELFTEEGIKTLLRVQENVNTLFASSTVIRMGDIMQGVLGSSWTTMAAVDYLKEQRKLLEISGSGIPGQNRVFMQTS